MSLPEDNHAIDRRIKSYDKLFHLPLNTCSPLIPCTGNTKTCPDMECSECSVRECPHGEPMHFHHDGCPSCSQAAQDEAQTIEGLRFEAAENRVKAQLWDKAVAMADARSVEQNPQIMETSNPVTVRLAIHKTSARMVISRKRPDGSVIFWIVRDILNKGPHAQQRLNTLRNEARTAAIVLGVVLDDDGRNWDEPNEQL